MIYNVDAIERGIEENKQISFLYFDYDEKHKKVYRKNGDRYTVNPAFMVWNRDNYYMLCFSNGHDDMVQKWIRGCSEKSLKRYMPKKTVH